MYIYGYNYLNYWCACGVVHRSIPQNVDPLHSARQNFEIWLKDQNTPNTYFFTSEYETKNVHFHS